MSGPAKTCPGGQVLTANQRKCFYFSDFIKSSVLLNKFNRHFLICSLARGGSGARCCFSQRVSLCLLLSLSGIQNISKKQFMMEPLFFLQAVIFCFSNPRASVYTSILTLNLGPRLQTRSSTSSLNLEPRASTSTRPSASASTLGLEPRIHPSTSNSNLDPRPRTSALIFDTEPQP